MRYLFTLMVLLAGAAVAAAPSHPVHGIDLPLEGEFPGGRGADQLIVYTPDAGREKTGTNRYGVEAIVVRDTVVSVGDNDNEIPEDGFVASGHGEAATWIVENLPVGTAVRLERDEEGGILHVDDSPIAVVNALRVRLERLRESPHFPADDEEIAPQLTSAEAHLRSMFEVHDFRQLDEVREMVEGFEQTAWENRLAAMPSPDGEVRGYWSRLPVFTEEEIVAYVEELAEAGVNVYMPEIIYGSQALYNDPTGLYPMFPQFRGFDPLEVILRECHARGIEVHAWVHCFFIGIERAEAEPALLAQRHPEWLAQNRKGEQVSEVEPGFMYFSPSHPEVREAMIKAHVAMVENYDIDGFQFDYIRYSAPRSWEDQWDYSDVAREKAENDLGFDPMDITPDSDPEKWEQWMQWREDEITTFVAEAAEAMREIDPEIVFTGAVFPDLESAIEEKGQNWAKWAQEGYITSLIPMSYSRSHEQIRRDMEEMKAVVPEDHPLVIGLGTYMGLTDEEIISQIEASREAGATGQVMFSWEGTNPETRLLLGRGPWRNRTDPVWERW